MQGLSTVSRPSGTKRNSDGTRPVRVVVMGAGMSGICMAYKLREAGIEDFTVYEKGHDVGGTWRENTYPGLQCDVPSRFYSYSFAPNPNWTHGFSRGGEIFKYFSGFATKAGLRKYMKFNTAITKAHWVDGRWQIGLSDGSTDVCDVLIAATGVLHHPRFPDIDGLDSFEGDCFHTAQWNHDVSLAGKRVAVIGNGSTGVQLVSNIASKVQHLTHFQRTPQWIAPMPNWPYPKVVQKVMEVVPPLNQAAYKFWQTGFERTAGVAVVRPGITRRVVGIAVRANLQFGVRDKELREKVRPHEEPLCKRMVISPKFYSVIQRDNVSVVTENIEKVEPKGVRTVDGKLHEIDVLLLATGFDAHSFMRPIDMVGEDGAALDKESEGGLRCYRSVAIPHFPNLFMLLGPNSPLGNNSLAMVAETQADYALRWIREIQQGRADSVSVTEDATAKFNEDVRAAMPKTVWSSGCNSWYLGDDGVPELWPWEPWKHREALAKLRKSDFNIKVTK